MIAFELLQAGEPDTVVGAILIFVVNLLIGAIAIHTGARLVIDADTGWRRAIVTALLGALAWAIVALFLGWIPLLGPLLALLVWIGVINWQYPGGWGTAAAVGLVAWLIAVVILYALSMLGIVGLDALGVPT